MAAGKRLPEDRAHGMKFSGAAGMRLPPKAVCTRGAARRRQPERFTTKGFSPACLRVPVTHQLLALSCWSKQEDTWVVSKRYRQDQQYLWPHKSSPTPAPSGLVERARCEDNGINPPRKQVNHVHLTTKFDAVSVCILAWS